MSGHTPQPDVQPAVISLGEIVAQLRYRAHLVALVGLVTFLLGVIYMHLAAPGYTVIMGVAPVAQQAGASRALGGLSSLVGANLNNGQANFTLYAEALQAKLIPAEGIAENQELLRRMFPQEWSEEEKKWHRPSSSFRGAVAFLKPLLGLPVQPWTPPNAERVMAYLRRLVIQQEPINTTIALQISASDPDLAIDILYAASGSVDQYLKLRALDRSTQSIAYIENQLAKATSLDTRAILLSMLNEQEQARMTASSNLPFAAQVFGTPIRPLVPNVPNGYVVLLLSLMGGLVLGCGIALLRIPLLERINMFLRRLTGLSNQPLAAVRDSQ